MGVVIMSRKSNNSMTHKLPENLNWSNNAASERWVSCHWRHNWLRFNSMFFSWQIFTSSGFVFQNGAKWMFLKVSDAMFYFSDFFQNFNLKIYDFDTLKRPWFTRFQKTTTTIIIKSLDFHTRFQSEAKILKNSYTFKPLNSQIWLKFLVIFPPKRSFYDS
jgi:hypothetical protein